MKYLNLKADTEEDLIQTIKKRKSMSAVVGLHTSAPALYY